MSKCRNALLTLRSPRSGRLEGWRQLSLWPSFETRASHAPQDEGWRGLRTIIAILMLITFSAFAHAGERKLNLGRAATPAEVAGWDIDVRPDGKGLPPGKGSVKDGEAVYMARCAACHGEFGESAGRWPQVAGG